MKKMDVKTEVFEDIVLFSNTFLNFKPFEYQKEFLRDNNKRIVIRSGRQIGKSTMTAIKALHRAIQRPKQQILVLAPSQRQSALLFNKILDFINYNKLIQTLFIDRQTMTMLFFKNGSSIYVVPAGFRGETIRGFSPHLIIIDEAAFVDDEVFVAVEPSIAATNGDLWLLSTPYGKRGKFYESFHDKDYSSYHLKSDVSPLITTEFLNHEHSIMTDNDYRQEYEGEFIDEADNFFTHELIHSCIADVESDVPTEHKYFLGVDCARFGSDETVYMIGEVQKELIKVVKIISTSKQPMTDIIGRVKQLHKTWKFQNVFMDETGMGGGAVDVLKEGNIPLQNLKGELSGIGFTLQNKEEMYNNLKLLMEKKMVLYPKHDKLILQMAGLEHQYTSSGGLSIHHPDNGHDDYPDCLALVCCGLRPVRPPLMFFSASLK